MRILRSLNRTISWLFAEKSFRRKFVGSMAKMLHFVPVSRAMDTAKPAKGVIYLENIESPQASPKILLGVGTDFTAPEFKPGGSIYLPMINGESHRLDIAEITGPERIVLKDTPLHVDAVDQLTGCRASGNGVKFKIAPHVDQTQVYNAVFQKLAANGCVGIFPEGGSHDRTELLPLKGLLYSSTKNLR